ncbi:hypothetical protein FIBSPDRAFT_887271 [Athelia psychrophila]|uniref:Uncharacterized protein n=1 Tax=Athelia psychrophila TaxID=1759441 RepID=A0A166PV61_9AGAM|nr:hypothetical protein FIBSPDRAFT_887271 [Fibularhizoctonia sp. CBS 109695]
MKTDASALKEGNGSGLGTESHATIPTKAPATHRNLNPLFVNLIAAYNLQGCFALRLEHGYAYDIATDDDAVLVLAEDVVLFATFIRDRTLLSCGPQASLHPPHSHSRSPRTPEANSLRPTSESTRYAAASPSRLRPDRPRTSHPLAANVQVTRALYDFDADNRSCPAYASRSTFAARPDQCQLNVLASKEGESMWIGEAARRRGMDLPLRSGGQGVSTHIDDMGNGEDETSSALSLLAYSDVVKETGSILFHLAGG